MESLLLNLDAKFGKSLRYAPSRPKANTSRAGWSVAAERGNSASVKGLTILYSFQGAPDGVDPNGGVIVDAVESIFGTTLDGGSASDGTVFALRRGGGAYRESLVHDFAGSDGSQPYAAPLADARGDLVVTAGAGGSNNDGSGRAAPDRRMAPHRLAPRVASPLRALPAS
jgi:hypothetical protein